MNQAFLCCVEDAIDVASVAVLSGAEALAVCGRLGTNALREAGAEAATASGYNWPLRAVALRS